VSYKGKYVAPQLLELHFDILLGMPFRLQLYPRRRIDDKYINLYARVEVICKSFR
jgi:hypothetical protein